MVGAPETALIVLRGNSGSGKTTLARSLQQRRGRNQLALISQDVVRREVLRADDREGNAAIALMDLMARYALEQGISVIVEGILHPERYSQMLTRLAADHEGRTLAYFWDLPFEETLRRHATKDNSSEFGEVEMRDWWYGRALIDELNEVSVGAETTLDVAIHRIETDCGWT